MRTLSRRCEGTGAGGGVFPVCCRAAWVACVGIGGPPAAWHAAAALTLAMALWMRSAGGGGVRRRLHVAQSELRFADVGVVASIGRVFVSHRYLWSVGLLWCTAVLVALQTGLATACFSLAYL